MADPTWLAVVVPGHGERVDDLARVVTALAGAGAEVRGVEWSGTDAPLVTDFEPVADEVAAELSAGPGLVFGYGVGGMIAVRHAQRYPEQVTALVLAAPVLGPWPVLDLLSDGEPDGMVGSYRRATLAAIDECLSTIDFDHPLGDELPALWLHGDDDRLVPVADARAGMDRVRGLRFEERIYPGIGHDLLHGSHAGGVLADITAFAGRVVQPS
ncbi:MAG TPA: alpha/beta hydrolase [Pseudonocardiaceae bacterium]|jgi:alpha-beta hydrolase superfamily lysophospholipase|nr:alpha/beta hydrolase [Pseudonocardiaceae bacterium]